MKVKKYRGQNYFKINKKLIKRTAVFDDPEFPACDRSLANEKFKFFDVEWKRPKELCQSPTFTIGPPSGKVMVQGCLGNCWFVAACAAMTQHKFLWQRVIPDGKQGWGNGARRQKAQKLYTGLFRFRFWRFGQWYEVVVDDLLPTKRGQLIFTKSKNENEFWCSLLEKAYAKFHGCYDALTGGNLADALLDISGGVAESINLKKSPAKTEQERKQLFSVDTFFRVGAKCPGIYNFKTLQLIPKILYSVNSKLKTLKRAFQNKAMIMTAIEAIDRTDIERVNSVGLLKNHAYAICEVRKLKLDKISALKSAAKIWEFLREFFREKDRIDVIKLRDPWGKSGWKGPWCRDSEEWLKISDSQKKQLGLIADEENGEFWMAFDDFCDFFTMVTVCYDFHSNRAQFKQRFQFYNEWSKGNGDALSNRCGGSVNEKETFLLNHQYMIKLYDSALLSKSQDLIISLLQADKRGTCTLADYCSIGLTLIKVEENRKYRIHCVRNLEVITMTDFVNARSTCLRIPNLASGRYIIIPSTYRANQCARFLLRIYSPRMAQVELLEEDVPKISRFVSCLFCRKPFTNLIRVKVVKATDLQWTDLSGYYVSIKTENKSYRSQTVHNTEEPVFNWSAIVYRNYANSNLQVQLWSAGKLRKKLLGTASLDPTLDNNLWQHQIPVADNNKRIVGKITMILIGAESLDKI